MNTNNCDNFEGGKIKGVFLIKKSDVSKKTGKLKRKYGNFKREIIKIK